MIVSDCTALSTVGFVPLSNGGVAIVDAEDLPRLTVNRWRAKPSDCGWPIYAVAQPGHRNPDRDKRMHRLVICSVGCIDHKNRNGLDNRKSNLRIATPAQNQANQVHKRGFTNPYRGVRRRPWKTKTSFQAYICASGRVVTLGTFTNAEDAARAYDRELCRRFGEFARPNFSTVTL